MRKITNLIMVAFCYCLYDIHLFRKKSLVTTNFEEISQSLSDRKILKKRVTKKYKNIKFKRRKFYENQRLKYLQSKPMDKRFSNQKMLRRMYRNS